MRIAPKVEVPKLDFTRVREWSPTVQPEGAAKRVDEAIKAMKKLRLRRQRKVQNVDSPITDLRRPKGCREVLWEAVLRRLGLFVGIHVAPDGRVVPGLEFLQLADAETELKTAAKTLSLVAALKLHDTLAVRLLFRGTGDSLWKAAACADVKRGGIFFFPPNVDGTVLKNLVGDLATEAEIEGACMVVRACPASQMAQLMHMVLEGVMAKHDQQAVGRFEAGIKYAAMRLIRNHEQFVDLMRMCSLEEMKQSLIDAILDSYDGDGAIEWSHAVELCRVTCALLEAGDAEAASMFITGGSLHPGKRMGGEILRILEADVAAGKTTVGTIVELERQLGEELDEELRDELKVELGAWADALRAIRDNAPSSAV